VWSKGKILTFYSANFKLRIHWGDSLKTAYIFKAKGMVLRVIQYLWSMKIFQQYYPTPSTVYWIFLTKLQFCCLNSHPNKSFSLPLNPILLVLSGQQMVATWLQINIYTRIYCMWPSLSIQCTCMVFFKSNIDVGNFKYQSYLPLKMSFQSVDVKSYTGFNYFYIISFLFFDLKTTGFFL
jgi:hypothetical protein